MGNWANCASAGSGAGYHAKVRLTKGKVTIKVGSGGNSVGSGGYTMGTSGEDSYIRCNTLDVTCGGGTACGAFSPAGTGGTRSGSGATNPIEVYVDKNGNNGTANRGLGPTGVTAGPISGHTWGEATSASAGYAGGFVGASKHGYIMIKKISK